MDMADEGNHTAGPLHDLTAFQRDVLAVVHANPGVSGLRIKEVLDDAWEQDINHGRLYPNLDHLVDQGLVAKGKQDDRTNEYQTTERGARELRLHLEWHIERAGDLLN